MQFDAAIKLMRDGQSVALASWKMGVSLSMLPDEDGIQCLVRTFRGTEGVKMLDSGLLPDEIVSDAWFVVDCHDRSVDETGKMQPRNGKVVGSAADYACCSIRSAHDQPGRTFIERMIWILSTVVAGRNGNGVTAIHFVADRGVNPHRCATIKVKDEHGVWRQVILPIDVDTFPFDVEAVARQLLGAE